MEITAFIPLRGASDCAEDGMPRFLLDGKPLWDHTLGHATQAKGLSRIVVAHDDPNFEARLTPWADRISLWRRPPELSAPGITTLDVLAAFARHEQGAGRSPRYYALLEITHPFRPRTLIEQVTAIAREHPADTILTARAVHYPIWRPNAMGVERLSDEHDGERLFEEMTGICSLFSPDCLVSENRFGDRVDVVPIDRFWAALDIRDEEVCRVAEAYTRLSRN